MKTWRKKIQDFFTAVSFTDVGEHDVALEMIGERRQPDNSPHALDRIMAALSFAEANCHDLAQEFLQPDKARRSCRVGEACTVHDFARAVGLGGIRLRLVEIAA
jgi:hypothetical protein